MRNLKKASKAYTLVQRLKKEIDFDDLTYAEGILIGVAIKNLEQVFRPYDAQYRSVVESEKRREEEIKKLCEAKGHIGEWTEEKYSEWAIMGDLGDTQRVPIEKIRWKRKCTRCGVEEVTEIEPEEVKKAKKEKEIKALEEKLEKMKEEL